MAKNKQKISWRLLGGVLFVLLTFLFLSGPRIDRDTTVLPLSLPQDLDDYLARSEARFSDIIPGTEKQILWASNAGQQTPLAVVYVHGFSASRQDTAPLAQELAGLLQANLFCTRLRGHGRGSEAMAEGSVNGWINDMAEAMAIGRRLGQRVILVGQSTGGTLAAWQAAAGEREGLGALVLLSPNFGPADPRSLILTWPWGGLLARVLLGRERSWEPENEGQGRYWTCSYPSRALLPMMGLIQLVAATDLGRIRVPTLVLYSPKDRIVDPDATRSAFERIGAPVKEIIQVTEAEDPSQHVLAGDILSPHSTDSIAEEVAGFVKASLGTGG